MGDPFKQWPHDCIEIWVMGEWGDGVGVDIPNSGYFEGTVENQGSAFFVRNRNL